MSDKTSFEKRVQGDVHAEIVLDENENPVTLPGKKFNHYKVRLYLETQNPEVQSVTYRLDPTYYDPVRESTDVDGKFNVELTTYGDYPVTVDAQIGGEIVRKVVPLFKLLQEEYGASASPEIKSALEEIKAH